MNEWTVDSAYAEFLSSRGKVDAEAKNLNEATTRLRVIDTVVFDILAWDKAEVDVEKYCRAEGYADYVFCHDKKPCLILEAKREGVHFLLPHTTYRETPYTFALLAKDCPEAMEALHQAAGYAVTLGCRFIAISNGHQWLFSLTFVEEQPLEDRLVFVFESVDAILRKFRQFWNCFSKEGLLGNFATELLLQSRRRPAPAKLSAAIPGYPAAANRNVFKNELSYILEIVWQVMSQNETTMEFLKSCYVPPTDHEDMISSAKELIDRRRQKDERFIEAEISAAIDLPTKFADFSTESPFVILGEVGRGKTSFLKYLRLVAAAEQFHSYMQIDIDFVDRPDNPSEVPDFIYGEIDRQLRQLYSIDIYEDRFVRGVLHGDLQRLQKGPKGAYYSTDKEKYGQMEIEYIEGLMRDRHSFLVRVFQHLKRGHKKSIAI